MISGRRLARRFLLEAALLWIRSLRPRFMDSPALPESGILILWHEHMLLCLPAFAKRNMRVLISRSEDGEWGARAAERLGYRVVRGSSSRGGVAALKNLARELRDAQGHERGWIAVIADGPRGPRRAAKPGAAWLGETSGLPTWCASGTSSGFALNSWDRCRVPLPFSTVKLRYSEVVPEANLAKPLISLSPEDVGLAFRENEKRLHEFLSLA